MSKTSNVIQLETRLRRDARQQERAPQKFSDACDLYMDRGRCGKTDAIYVNRLRRELGAASLDRMTWKLIDVMVTKERTGRGLEAGSIRRELNTCQAILNYAADMELTHNRVKIKKPSGDKKREVWLEAHQVRDFIEACEPEFRAFAMFLFFTGMRLGEAIEARWEHVLNGEFIEVKSRKGKGSVEKVRSVPLHPKLIECLGGVQSHGWILQFHGRQWHRPTVYDYWNRAKYATGNPKLTPHCARHTYASLLSMGGTEAITLATLLGHATMDMVKRYTHLNTKHLRSTVLNNLGV